MADALVWPRSPWYKSVGEGLYAISGPRCVNRIETSPRDITYSLIKCLFVYIIEICTETESSCGDDTDTSPEDTGMC